MTMAFDLAALMVDHCNDEGRDLDAEEFAFRTDHCSVIERDAVWRELPTWAQRRIEHTTGMLG
jgi:hypothetical protein